MGEQKVLMLCMDFETFVLDVEKDSEVHLFSSSLIRIQYEYSGLMRPPHSFF